MSLSKALPLVAAGTLVLSACGLSDEEKVRIVEAEENIQKIALAPQITKPSADEAVSGNVKVYVDVDTGELSNYASVQLFIEGEPELIDEEFPYEFNFNAYYWSDNQKISLLAKIETVDGNQLRSEVVSVPLAEDANTAISISSPLNSSVLRSVDETTIIWSGLEDAVSYEYQLNEGEIVSTEDNSAQVSLPQLGLYQIRVRATNALGHTGDWSDLVNFSLETPQVTTITSPTSGQIFQNTNQVSLAWQPVSDAVFYEYQINDESVSQATKSNTTLSDLEPGEYTVRVRAIDSFDSASEWSDTVSFSLRVPDRPNIASTSVSETEEAFELSVHLSNIQTSNEVQIATDNSFESDSVVSTNSANLSQVDSELVAGIYYIRARTTNEFGHISEWSESEEVNIGMFAHAINGVSPSAFVFDEGHFVIAANSGPSLGVASGDRFYITRVSVDGTKKWGKGQAGEVSSPETIRKTDSGFLLSAKAINYRDPVVFELDDQGDLLWKETVSAEPDTYEYLHDAVKVSEDKYIILGETDEWENGVGWQITSKLKYLDRSTPSPLITEHTFDTHPSGEYRNINDLLLTDGKLYAVGEYVADTTGDSYQPSHGLSGAVLFEVDTSNGSIISENTRTADGLENRTGGEVVLASDGDIYVSYEKEGYYFFEETASVSTFHSSGQSTDFGFADGLKQNGTQLAADNDNNVYMSGLSVNDSPAIVVRFNEAEEQERLSLDKYSNDLSIVDLSFDSKYGLLVLATDQGAFDVLSATDQYMVMFNINSRLQYMAPDSYVTDIGD